MFLISTLIIFFAAHARAMTGCPDELIESYKAKEGCLFDGNFKDCMKDAAIVAGGAGAGIAGGLMTAKILAKFAQGLGQKQAEQFRNAQAVVETEQRNLEEAQRIYRNERNRLASRVSVNKSTSYFDLEVSAREFRQRFPQIEMGNAASVQLRYVNDQLPGVLKKIVESMSGKPEVAKYLKVAIARKTPPAFTLTAERINELYPEEAAKLRPLLEDQEIKMKKMLTITREFHDHPDDPKLAAESKAAANAYAAADVAIEKYIRSAPPSMKDYAEFLKMDQQSASMREYFRIRSSLTQADSSLPKTQKFGQVGGVAGVIVTQIALSALDLFSNVLGKNEIKNCEIPLNLSKEEIDFLGGNYYLFSHPKAGMTRGRNNSCADIELRDGVKVLKEAQQKWGVIPPGICQIVSNQVGKLRLLVNQEKVSVNTCQEFRTPTLSVSGEGYSKNFVYHGVGYDVEAPFDQTLGWIDYSNVVVRNRSGTIDRDKTNQLKRDHFLEGYTSASVEANINQYRKDLASGCNAERSMDTMDCGLLQALSKARIYSALVKTNCRYENEKLSPVVATQNAAAE